jgi:hypothetical protein
MSRLAVTFVAILALGLGSAAAQGPPGPPPPGPPPGAPPPPAAVPAPRYEAVPPPPGPRVVWQPGHWHWNGVRYVWFPGAYVERRPGYGHYVPGHWRWSPGRGQYVWVAAHWE